MSPPTLKERLARLHEEGRRLREERKREAAERKARLREARKLSTVAGKQERERMKEEARREARDRHRSLAERREAKRVVSAIASAEWREVNPPPPKLRRCLNPECLIWFTSRDGTANACSPACRKAIERIWVSSRGTLSLTMLRRHARLQSKRAAGVYDTPVPTPYALRLVAAVEHDRSEMTGLDAVLHAATMAAENRTRGIASALVSGYTEHRAFRGEDGDTFNDFYLLGSAAAAAFPNRPCDHSGIRSCQTPPKRYKTTSTP